MRKNSSKGLDKAFDYLNKNYRKFKTRKDIDKFVKDIHGPYWDLFKDDYLSSLEEFWEFEVLSNFDKDCKYWFGSGFSSPCNETPEEYEIFKNDLKRLRKGKDIFRDLIDREYGDLYSRVLREFEDGYFEGVSEELYDWFDSMLEDQAQMNSEFESDYHNTWGDPPNRGKYAMNRNRRNRRNRIARNKRARIDVVLKPSEIDVFAGMAEDLHRGLLGMYEEMQSDLQDLLEEKFFVEREVKILSEKKKQIDAAFKSLEKTFDLAGVLESAELQKALVNVDKEMGSQEVVADAKLASAQEDMQELLEEIEEIEGNGLFETLGDLVKDLDQDLDDLEGLTAFSNVLGKIVQGAGDDDFIVDILGSSDGRKMILFMDRIGS